MRPGGWLTMTASLVCAAACNQLLGNSTAASDDEPLRADAASSGIDATTTPDATFDAEPEPCSASQKSCNGRCVELTAVEYGCATASCAPCDLAHADVLCGGDGSCVIASCEAGFDDCDHLSSTGCEADLGSNQTCGSCGTLCAPTLVCSPLPSGGAACQEHCTAGMTSCPGQGCKLLTADENNCGGCGTVCPDPVLGNKLCVNSKCDAQCDPGTSKCNGDCVEPTVNACGLNCLDCAALPHVVSEQSACHDRSCAFSCAPPWRDSDGLTGNGCECDSSVPPGCP